MNNLDHKPLFYTKKEVAYMLSISMPTLDRLMAKKEIEYRKLGRSVRFAREYIENFGKESMLNVH